MTKTQYFTATSADGFIADQNYSLDWLFEVDQGGVDTFGQFFADVGAFAMGATSYKWMLEHLNLLDNPNRWREMYGDVPAWVLTHRELPAIPGASLIMTQGDVRPVHEAMSNAAGDKNIWLVGGGELVGQFVDHGLVDEITLEIAPVMLGAGAPLLPRRLLSSQLSLTDVGRAGQMVVLTYSVST
jgi:dihydrofolate reductase